MAERTAALRPRLAFLRHVQNQRHKREIFYAYRESLRAERAAATILLLAFCFSLQPEAKLQNEMVREARGRVAATMLLLAFCLPLAARSEIAK